MSSAQPVWRKEKGRGDKYGPNTQNVTVTQLHTFNVELAYWQRQKQECTALYCNTHTFPHIQQSRACQGARKLFDCLFLLPVKLIVSEHMLADLVQGYQRD